MKCAKCCTSFATVKACPHTQAKDFQINFLNFHLGRSCSLEMDCGWINLKSLEAIKITEEELQHSHVPQAWINTTPNHSP